MFGKNYKKHLDPNIKLEKVTVSDGICDKDKELIEDYLKDKILVNGKYVKVKKLPSELKGINKSI